MDRTRRQAEFRKQLQAQGLGQPVGGVGDAAA